MGQTTRTYRSGNTAARPLTIFLIGVLPLVVLSTLLLLWKTYTDTSLLLYHSTATAVAIATAPDINNNFGSANLSIAAAASSQTQVRTNPHGQLKKTGTQVVTLTSDPTILAFEDDVSVTAEERTERQKLNYLERFDYHTPALSTRYTLPDPYVYNHTDSKLVVLVLSARPNFLQRQVIRETWGANHSVYFIIGAPVVVLDDDNASVRRQKRRQQKQKGSSFNNVTLKESFRLLEPAQIQPQLEQEQAQFHDLLDTVHPDSYRSLPYKVHYAYRWVTLHVPTAHWLVKADDDTVVRVDTLYQALLRSLNHDEYMVVGKIMENASVARTGKWAELEYAQEVYPYWPRGSCGHAVSRATAAFLANQTNLHYYQGEDTSIGIWLDETKDIQVTWIHSKYFRNDGNCLDHAWLIMGHKLSVEKMRSCHAHADEWQMEDLQHKRGKILVG